MNYIRCCVLVVAGLVAHPVVAQQSLGRGGLVEVVVQDAASLARLNGMETSSTQQSNTLQRISNDLPASIARPSGILSIAPAGVQILPALPTICHGCELRPDIRCQGPVYSTCAPYLYYGTDAQDDDPILPLFPQINDVKTKHWYHAALKMVRRKKAVTEAIK